MKNKFIIERKELFCLLVNIITIKMFFSYPRKMMLTAGNAAWLQCIFVSLVAIILYLITINIYKRAGNVNILNLAEKVGGRTLKIIIGIIIVATLLINVSLTLRNLPESIKSALLPLTPMRFLIIFLSVCAAIGAYIGIYSIARIHALYIPVCAIVFVSFILLLLPSMNINNIFPVLGKGTYNIFVKGLDSLSMFSDILLLYILMPFARSFNDVKKTGFFAIGVSSLVSIVIVFVYNLLFSYPSIEEYILPVYQMSRLIQIGDFFQRLEVFFEFIWSIAMLLYASIYIFTICYVWKEIFNLKYYKPLPFPFTVLVAAISYIPSSTVDLVGADKTLSYFTTPICLGLPLIIALIYKVKAKNKSTYSGES